ncbi:MAG: tRNA (adenosine(37)-N6)-threonylcarbamoyltransferase complex dimerization subunit type 1 TsaB, partial [Armatimonadota bacterium]|nr:tRNA (adenosine(37)-N6)-threonylcarbamoyltransferase complex dimerization subunit type 1 TsaB [Armatimonadota bacterium]
MLILALDTSGDVCTIALCDDSGLVAQTVFKHKMDLLQRLAPNIKWALDDSGLTPNDLDAVAVSLGPGSFTGIRIGVTTAKGLAYAADKKIIGLPTLDILAAGMMAEPMDLIVPLLVARPGEVYNAIYRFDGKRPAKLTEDSALSIDELNDRILG